MFQAQLLTRYWGRWRPTGGMMLVGWGMMLVRWTGRLRCRRRGLGGGVVMMGSNVAQALQVGHQVDELTDAERLQIAGHVGIAIGVSVPGPVSDHSTRVENRFGNIGRRVQGANPGQIGGHSPL